MVDPLPRLRTLCLAMPEATEKLSHGEPSWFVRRQFAMYANHHHDDRLAIWIAAPEGGQRRWLDTDPDRFFHPPYVGVRGWVGVYLDLRMGAAADRAHWTDIAEIVEDGYRHIAPARLVRELDAQQATSEGREAD